MEKQGVKRKDLTGGG